MVRRVQRSFVTAHYFDLSGVDKFDVGHEILCELIVGALFVFRSEQHAALGLAASGAALFGARRVCWTKCQQTRRALLSAEKSEMSNTMTEPPPSQSMSNLQQKQAYLDRKTKEKYDPNISLDEVKQTTTKYNRLYQRGGW